MGQFSWLDCLTGEQIVDDKERDVYVLVPKEFGGGHIKETCYDGYGNFGGHDIYDLIVDWNCNHLDYIKDKLDTWVCEWIREKFSDEFNKMLNGDEVTFTSGWLKEKRDMGIALACYDDDNERLYYPIKITHNKNAVYEMCPPSKGDPNQGWEYDDDDDWDDIYD